jgi:predicted TIM-barrel fold metal-dependent hydrolase
VVPDALRLAVDELGEDHLLMAMDSPHFDSEYAHTVAKTKANNLSFPSSLTQC